MPGRLMVPLSGEVGEHLGDILDECFVGDGVFIFQLVLRIPSECQNLLNKQNSQLP